MTTLTSDHSSYTTIFRVTDYRRERQSYVSRAGGDEGGQGWDGRIVLREMWGRQARRKTGRRRQETEEGGKDYQMRRWKSCGQHLTPDKGKRGRERDSVFCLYDPWPTTIPLTRPATGSGGIFSLADDHIAYSRTTVEWMSDAATFYM